MGAGSLAPRFALAIAPMCRVALCRAQALVELRTALAPLPGAELLLPQTRTILGPTLDKASAFVAFAMIISFFEMSAGKRLSKTAFFFVNKKTTV